MEGEKKVRKEEKVMGKVKGRDRRRKGKRGRRERGGKRTDRWERGRKMERRMR